MMTYLQWGCCRWPVDSIRPYRVCLIQAPRLHECRPEKSIAGLILGLRPANERCRYFVTTSLIGWHKPRISPVLVTSVHYTEVQMPVMPTECHKSDHQGVFALSAMIKLPPRKRECRQIDYIFVTGRTRSWSNDICRCRQRRNYSQDYGISDSVARLYSAPLFWLTSSNMVLVSGVRLYISNVFFRSPIPS